MAFNWLTAISKQVRNLVLNDSGQLTIGETGNLKYNREYWDDLRFPATALNPPGAASDPDYDTTYGWPLFDAAGTEVLFLQAQLPHECEPDSVLSPHLHWCKTTSASGNVYWQLDYRWMRIGETMDGSWTTSYQTTPVVSDADTAYHHALTAFDDIDAPHQLSDMLIIKVSRIGGNAADTYGADAALMEFDIHYQRGQPGSRQEYIY